MFEFREIFILLLIFLAIPLYVWMRRPRGSIKFSSLKLWPEKSKSFKSRTSFVPPLLLVLALALFIISFAGPRVPNGVIRQHREGISMMMVIDKSGSMAALDMSKAGKEQNRLEAVKDVLNEFIRGNGKNLKGRPDDSIGVVSFATYPDSDCPLTLDHVTLMSLINDVQMNQEESSTSMGDAIGLAAERLRQATGNTKVMILLTDGVNNAGYEDPMDTARMAADFGIKIYTIGVGTNGFAPVRTKNFWGNDVIQQVPVELDEKGLTEIAEMTGGQYFRATDREGLEKIYATIDKLEKTKISEDRKLKYDEKYWMFLELGMLLAALGFLLSVTYYRRSPM